MRLVIPSPAGYLEAALEPALVGEPEAVAVLCHPYPQYGGTMNNKVVVRAAQAFQEIGMATLRFNFRGVGKSTGSYDFGEGEQQDVRAALNYVVGQYPHARIWVCGYSFGSWVGLKVGARDHRVSSLLGLGTPVAVSDFGFLIVECVRRSLPSDAQKDKQNTADADGADQHGCVLSVRMRLIRIIRVLTVNAVCDMLDLLLA